jgi:hypothetical protein
VDIGSVQRQAWENKLAKGFNTTDVALEFGLLTGACFAGSQILALTRTAMARRAPERRGRA